MMETEIQHHCPLSQPAVTYPAELTTEPSTSPRSSIITIPVYLGPTSPTNPPYLSPLPMIIQGSAQEPPPSYEEVVDPKCDPPSYNSLFDSKQSTLENSRNVIDFGIKNLIKLLLNNLCDVFCCAIIPLAIPVLMIVFGSVYLDDCGAQPYIPIFLIVGGSLLSIKYLLYHLCQMKKLDECTDRPIQHLITVFLCCWMIAGYYWVFSLKNYRWNYILNPVKENYCNDVVYTFTFTIILTSGAFGLFFIFVGVVVCLCDACDK